MLTKPIYFVFLFSIISGCGSTDAATEPVPQLKGAAYVNNSNVGAPFLFLDGNKYSGFSVDILNGITGKGTPSFSYHLYRPVEWRAPLSGVAEDVYFGRADFAAGDLDDYPPLANYVTFSEPIFADQTLGAIVSRKLAYSLKLCSVANLVNDQHNSPPIDIWVRSFHYLETLRAGNHTLTDRLYQAVIGNGSSLNIEYKLENTLTLLKEQRVAFLMEFNSAQFLFRDDCELVVLRDLAALMPRKIVFYLQRGSPYLAAFNEGIRRMKADGTVDRLHSDYWISQWCPQYQC